VNEQEVKDTVEQIVNLEQQADELMESENFTEASACMEAVSMMETDLEEQGYFLGESGTDMIVFRKGFPEVAKDEWMRYDRATGSWKQSERT
jgi:hypothetical protein